MKHYQEKHAKVRLGIHNILQMHYLQLWEAQKPGSSGFQTGSGGFPIRWGGFRRRSGGFPARANALHISHIPQCNPL